LDDENEADQKSDDEPIQSMLLRVQRPLQATDYPSLTSTSHETVCHLSSKPGTRGSSLASNPMLGAKDTKFEAGDGFGCFGTASAHRCTNARMSKTNFFTEDSLM
jgi:hypothetical protein